MVIGTLCLVCTWAFGFGPVGPVLVDAQVMRKQGNRIVQQQGIKARTREALAISGLSASTVSTALGTSEARPALSTPSSVSLHLQAIPKIIHHTYSTGPNSTGFDKVFFNVSYFSFKKFFPEPEFKYLFHTDPELERCIAEEFPQFLREFQSFRGYAIEKTDAGRYCILWKYGGIYADLDYEVFRPFYDHLAPGRVNLNESPYEENKLPTVQVQNALMAAPPRHPFWLHVFEQMGKDGMHFWNTSTGTGPSMMSLVAARHPDDIFALPCQHFQRLRHCGDLRDFDQVFAVHWNVNSYTEYSGVPNIWHRQKESWEHFHPKLAFPWTPPVKSDSMELQASLVVGIIFLMLSLHGIAV
mmetsp:Transcript_68731/g.119403  ORF Transcript_68731/g.119403 Transcript_68731/m.119403 type:complete len:356 (-) Transcript_68731:75-1142(-)